MWLSRKVYERLVSEAALAHQVPKLELRAEEAERLLATERVEYRRDLRHFASMWLRHNGTYPLTPTADEKTEKQAEKAQQREQPPKLNADQLARRDAVRAWAKREGLTEEDADRSFMAQLAAQVDE